MAGGMGDRQHSEENLLALDYTTLELLRQNHPAWRLLRAQHAPLVASFLHRIFIVPNVRQLSQADLVEALDDELFALRAQLGAGAFPGTAQSYLNDWAENDKGWLRKFYPAGTDEPHFDLTPATEKALAWIEGLSERAFVGTESRLLTCNCRVSYSPIFARWRAISVCSTAACASALRFGRGPKGRCLRKSWASGMRSPIRTRAKASGRSGTF